MLLPVLPDADTVRERVGLSSGDASMGHGHQLSCRPRQDATCLPRNVLLPYQGASRVCGL